MLPSTFASKYLKVSQRMLSLLDQCHHMRQIKQIQSHLTVSGTLLDPYVSGKIISFCATSHLDEALSHGYSLFLRLQNRTTFIWNTMIRGFAENNQSFKAITIYKSMLDTYFPPNNYTFSFVLRACANLSDLFIGLQCHGQVIKYGWESYDFVLNGLVHLYATCNCMDSARRLFDMSDVNRDVITWTSLISGYVKSHQVAIARQLFDQMPEKNVVSWSAMINGYVQVRMFEEALELFNGMLTCGVRPNQAGIIGALTACAFLGALDQGRWIHAYVERNKMELDRVLGTALIDMYAKCGCIETARSVFDNMSNKDVFAFTSLISGLANHGQSGSAIKLFVRMQNEGVAPNEVTFILHGDVELGKETVESLVERSLDHGGVHVLLSNMYASANQWDGVVKVRKGMGDKNVRKIPGCSLIEVDGMVCEFVCGDRYQPHVLMEETESWLIGIDKHLKSLCLDDDMTIKRGSLLSCH
ncbi:hypothetical protein Q3G72_003964 [Acer saccharum]|nr:hypothetical protein Q3G72_003964 [Acer saccharum]